MKRYSAGRIEIDGTEDFYWDTQFESIEECIDWGINHDCTHVFDTESNTFIEI